MAERITSAVNWRLLLNQGERLGPCPDLLQPHVRGGFCVHGTDGLSDGGYECARAHIREWTIDSVDVGAVLACVSCCVELGARRPRVLILGDALRHGETASDRGLVWPFRKAPMRATPLLLLPSVNPFDNAYTLSKLLTSGRWHHLAASGNSWRASWKGSRCQFCISFSHR
jgi:hypothetical protein